MQILSNISQSFGGIYNRHLIYTHTFDHGHIWGQIKGLTRTQIIEITFLLDSLTLKLPKKYYYYGFLGTWFY